MPADTETNERVAEGVALTASKVLQIIGPFKGEWAFLSNFAPARVEWDGEVYPTVEHAFQAAKTLNPEERQSVQQAPTPAAAKKRGKQVTLRADWTAVKVSIMEDLVRQKFLDPGLAEKLLATGNQILQEINFWNDQFWGVSKGKGKNHLGAILMRVRKELQEQAGAGAVAP